MKIKMLVFFAGLASGAILMWSFPLLHKEAPPHFRYPVAAKLYRMRINKAQLPTYQDWVAWHTLEKTAVNATMEREKMYAEALFRDTINEPDAIYWLAISGEGGKTYQGSPLPADKKHAAYMKQILVKGSGSVLKTEFLMLPPFEENTIALHQKLEK